MSLFGFVKDIGRRVFNKDEEAAEKIQEMVAAANPGIENLEVKYEDGFVELCGECTSVEAVEKAVLMVGNIAGVKDVNVAQLTLSKEAQEQARQNREAAKAAAAAKPDEDAKTAAVNSEVDYYTIVSGDSLSKIAKRFYGDPMKYKELFEANREIIEDPDKIFPGQKIRIPRNLA
ncbi:MAG: peptidoglycan-binding protein LysM [Gammaproteobacteria bacterium]|nr:peptidoglycan-binding protein LysM [Gammaproteobacteria bacterium]